MSGGSAQIAAADVASNPASALGRVCEFTGWRSCRSRPLEAEGRLTVTLLPDTDQSSNGRSGRLPARLKWTLEIIYLISSALIRRIDEGSTEFVPPSMPPQH